MTCDFPHVADEFTRAALSADPRTLRPEVIRRLAEDALYHAEQDLGDPDVHNAGVRMEIAEAAVAETDPVRVHALVRRFWSV